MANSPYQDTVFILDFLSDIEPKSILDIGAGFGRWGFLCRCHLGRGESLTLNPDQPLRIDAIEAYEPNVNPVYRAVYNATYRGDARAILPTLGAYDVILWGHGPEHLEKTEACALIAEARRHARMAVILGIPFNDPLRAPRDGNAFEAHRSVWTADDFAGEDALVRGLQFTRSVQAGVVVYPCDASARWHAEMRRRPWKAFLLRRVPGLLRIGRRLFRRGRAPARGGAGEPSAARKEPHA